MKRSPWWLLVPALFALLLAGGWGCDRAPDATSISGVSIVEEPSAPAQDLTLSSMALYDVTPINATTGLRVNQSGDVVGWSMPGSTPVPILYTAENGVIVLPTTSSPTYGVARDLSERVAGVITVVGEARLNGTGSSTHAVRWRVAVPQGTVTSVTDLGVLPGHIVSAAHAVNGAGQITGVSDANNSLSTRSFLHSNAAMVDLGLGGPGQSARALDLNAAGTVTGYLGLTAFRWSSAGRLQSLGVPAGWAYSFGFAINTGGQVAGYASNASGSSLRVARYTDGAGWKILGGMGQRNYGYGINQWGDVVGTGFPRTGSTPGLRGVIYTDQLGGLAYVDDFLRVPGSWRIMEAYDINDARQITGWGIDTRTGLRSAVLLTPASAPPPPPPGNQPPVARFTVTCSPGQCVLIGSSSTDDQGVVSYRWRASVKTRAPMTGELITRLWIAGGANTYQETLTVMDASGLTGSQTQTITIPAP